MVDTSLVIGQSGARCPDDVIGAEERPGGSISHTGNVGNQIVVYVACNGLVGIRHGILRNAARSIRLVEVDKQLSSLVPRAFQCPRVIGFPVDQIGGMFHTTNSSSKTTGIIHEHEPGRTPGFGGTQVFAS